MENVIIIAVLLVVVGLAVRYIYKAKKSGAKCVGCSAGEGGCTCHCQGESTCGCCGEDK